MGVFFFLTCMPTLLEYVSFKIPSRYLLEKARVMNTEMYVILPPIQPSFASFLPPSSLLTLCKYNRIETEEESGSIWSFRSLKGAFKWEIRALYVGFLAGPLYIVHPTAGWATFAVLLLLVGVTDLVFSVIAARIFLRPILQVMCVQTMQNSEGYRSLHKTKWHTLIGSSIAVFSSSFLCKWCAILFFANPST